MAQYSPRIGIVTYKTIQTNTTGSERKLAVENHVEETQRRRTSQQRDKCRSFTVQRNCSGRPKTFAVQLSPKRCSSCNTVSQCIQCSQKHRRPYCINSRAEVAHGHCGAQVGFYTRRVVSSVMQATLPVTGTTVMCTKLRIQPETEVCDICPTLDGDVPQEDYIAARFPTTTVHTVSINRVSTT